MAMLREQGREVTIEQATLILDFMRKMAKGVIESYLNSQRPNISKKKWDF